MFYFTPLALLVKLQTPVFVDEVLNFCTKRTSEFQIGGKTKNHSHSPHYPCKNERISLFDLAFLSFELHLHQHHVFLASSSSENQKAAEFFKRRFLRKKDGPSPMKSVAFF
jgi:hypothetical protein